MPVKTFPHLLLYFVFLKLIANTLNSDDEHDDLFSRSSRLTQLNYLSSHIQYSCYDNLFVALYLVHRFEIPILPSSS